MSSPYGVLHVGGTISFQVGSNFAVSLSGASGGQLVIAGAATIGTGADISISVGSALTNSTYTLATAASGLSSSTPFTVLGSLPTGYSLVYNGTSLILTAVSNGQYTLTTTPASLNVHTGGTTTVATVIANTGTGTQGALNYNTLTSSVSTGGASGSVATATGTTSGSNLATGTNNSPGASQTFAASSTAGNVTLGNSATVSNVIGSGTPVATNNGATVNVYSGLSTWNVNGGGSWSTAGTGAFGAGANWGANQGAPGVTAGFANTDTATFNNSVLTAGSSATVSLNGASPSLRAITFNTQAGSGYTIAQGSGGTLALDGNSGFGNGNAQVAVTSGTHVISAPVSLTTSADVNVSSGQQLNFSGAISGGNSLNNIGAGATILSSATGNTYSGGTTISLGTVYANSASGSSTGTGSVSVSSGGTLAGGGTIKPTGGAGVTISSGATLASGSVQTANAYANGGNGSVNGTGTGGGLTLDNTEASSSLLKINGGATLTFALGSSTTYNGGSGSLNFASPNTNSTFLYFAGSTIDQIFNTTTTADVIKLVDLTNGAPSGSVSLTLRSQNPYLLIKTDLGNNNDFANLMTSGGLGQNGYVTGISNGAGGYTAFTIGAYDINGNLISSSNNLQNLQLFLYNGNLEVVPEPGTWALMISGLALLIFIQRRKNKGN